LRKCADQDGRHLEHLINYEVPLITSFSANFSYNFSLFLCGIDEQIVIFLVITEIAIIH